MFFRKKSLAIAILACIGGYACSDNTTPDTAPEASASSAAQQAATSAPEVQQNTVSLRFAWPPEVRGEVSFRREKVEQSGPNSHEQTILGNYKLATQQVEQGLLINKFDHHVEIEKSPYFDELSPVDQQAQNFLLKATSQSPLYVVNGNGAVLGFFDIEEFKQRMIEAANEWAEGISEHSPVKERIPTVIKGVTDGQNIEAGLISVWNREVAVWAGQTFVEGKAYQTQGTQRFDTLDFVEVPVNLTLTYLGDVPCNEQSTKPDCVKLEYAYALDQSSMDVVKERFLAAKDDGRYDIESADFRYRLTVVTEPNTLMPHSTTEYELKEHKVLREGYTPIYYKREITNTTTYTYSQRLDKMMSAPSFDVQVQE